MITSIWIGKNGNIFTIRGAYENGVETSIAVLYDRGIAILIRNTLLRAMGIRKVDPRDVVGQEEALISQLKGKPRKSRAVENE